MFDYISGYHGPANLMHKKQSQKPNGLIIEKRDFPGMLCARDLAAVTALWSDHIEHVFSDGNRYFSFILIMAGSHLEKISYPKVSNIMGKRNTGKLSSENDYTL